MKYIIMFGTDLKFANSQDYRKQIVSSEYFTLRNSKKYVNCILSTDFHIRSKFKLYPNNDNIRDAPIDALADPSVTSLALLIT